MAFDSVPEVAEPFSLGARKRKRATAGLKLFVSRDEIEGDMLAGSVQVGVWRAFYEMCFEASSRRHLVQYGDHGSYRWSIRVEDVAGRFSRFVEIKSSQGERFVASLYPAYYPNTNKPPVVSYTLGNHLITIIPGHHLDHRFTIHASSDSMLMMGLMMADAIG
jgi:hypothetical protein